MKNKKNPIQQKKKNSIKNYFLTGILVSAPLAITIYLAVELILFIDTKISALIPIEYKPMLAYLHGIPGFGVIVLFVGLIFIGWISSGFFGNTLLKILNKAISKMPVVSGLYNGLKKILETVMGSGQNQAFREAVLVQYPREGLWTIAFITGDVYSGIKKHFKKEKMVSIYVPTTPNPTSGFLIFVNKKDIIPLDLRVDDAWKIIISTGIVTPDSPQNQQKIMEQALAKAAKDLKN
ncbi:MAG: DUF502 domain-containing protein [Alphaproteobacteria bacterium]|nr:DUF502 domain-containing protein [Alphaproteobacteria bacterium]